MMAGYSGTPLAKKLGYKEGQRVFLLGPPAGYLDWISPLPDDLELMQRMTPGLDLIHLFVKEVRGLKTHLSKGKKYLQSDGMIWVSWPKKSSGVTTDLTENVIREEALKIGLVDVKVCAVNEVWSGLKLVIPLTER